MVNGSQIDPLPSSEVVESALRCGGPTMDSDEEVDMDEQEMQVLFEQLFSSDTDSGYGIYAETDFFFFWQWYVYNLICWKVK